ncbi:MAG: pilus assembly protein PilM [Candidatus Roizmanbacteria bacterium]|nr:pilus assembly protein PilM [Candidatus Roizmanbacteria bacterium]
MARKVGIIIEQKTITFVDVTDTTGGYQLSKVLSVPMPSPNFYDSIDKAPTEELVKERNIVRDTLTKEGLGDREAYFVIPDYLASMQILNLPIITDKEIVSAIELQADEFIPYPLSKASYDYQIIASDKQKNAMSVLVLVSLQDVIKGIENFILDIGLYPTSLESVSSSLFKSLFHKNHVALKELVVLMNMEDRSTQISVINTKNNLVIMTYTINIGSTFFVHGIQNYANVLPQEAAALFAKPQVTEENQQKKLLSMLFDEFSKELVKVMTSTLERLNLMPQSLLLVGEHAASLKLLFDAFPSSQIPASEMLTFESMAKALHITPSIAVEPKKVDPFVAAVSTCL